MHKTKAEVTVQVEGHPPEVLYLDCDARSEGYEKPDLAGFGQGWYALGRITGAAARAGVNYSVTFVQDHSENSSECNDLG